jgi:fatty acid desaturase
MVIKSFAILFSYAASFYFTFFGSTNMWLKTLAAASMGFFAAEFGMSIQHDANHGRLLSQCFSPRKAISDGRTQK